jgi:hypothetical protein
MTTRISPRDWEALSAYLDGQLSPNELTRLEKRLRLSADLRAALEDLRRTRALLRSQPRLKAPRNFTLTPEMVGRSAPQRSFRRSPSSLYPTLSLASALAGLLFVVILVTDLLNLGPAAIPMAAEPVAKQAAVTEQVSLLAKPQAAPETSGAQATEAPAAAAPAAESQAFSPTGTPGLGAGPPAAASNLAYPGATERAGDILPTSTVEGVTVPTEPELQAQRAIEPAASPPAVAEAPAQSQAADSAVPAETPAETARGFWTEWRALEVALALIALAAGLAAFWLRRSGSV